MGWGLTSPERNSYLFSWPTVVAETTRWAGHKDQIGQQIAILKNCKQMNEAPPPPPPPLFFLFFPSFDEILYRCNEEELEARYKGMLVKETERSKANQSTFLDSEKILTTVYIYIYITNKIE